MAHDHPTDRPVIVDNRGSGSGAGAILAVIVVLALLVGVWYFAMGPGQGTFGGTTEQPNINVDVNLPSADPAD